MDVSVILIEPERGLNIGFVARVMKNFGFDDLKIVGTSKRLLPSAARYASHAGALVEKVRMFSSIKEAIEDSDLVIGTTALRGGSPHNVLRTPTSPSQLAKRMARIEGHASLLFGREGSGLSNRELDLCDSLATIPCSSDYPTMNLSHAVAVFLYEIRTARLSSPPSMVRGSSLEAKRVLLQSFESILKLDEIPEHRRGVSMRAWKNVIGRAQLSMRETSLLTGVLRRIVESQTFEGSQGA